MAKNKTVQTEDSVTTFLNRVENEKKRDDSFKLIEIYKAVTGFEPKMWGPTIIGFGSYHYKYESGHEGDAPLAGFSPRKDAIVLYFAPDFDEKEVLLSQFGKHKSSKACVYIKKLEDVDVGVLGKMIGNSVGHISRNKLRL